MIPVLFAVMATIPWAVGRRQPRLVEPARRPVDLAVVIDLVSAGLGAGASIPSVLEALAVACDEDDLGVVGRALRLSAPWEVAWEGVSPRFAPLSKALEPAWRDGVGPLPLLESAASRIRRTRHQAAKEAAEKLAVRLVVPLGVCQLPAFVLLGLVPVLVGLL
ncbi:MAG: type II secretion protein F [Actinomycetaceae bacterium]|nr:type II secretion protein F [Actinomycetaceae bacterium]MDU0971008.1 type II secretion protein F [Actinomycetaceae bacterium]